MNKRNENDLRVLKSPHMGIDEVSVWARELFLGVGMERFKVPEDMLEFGIGVMLDNYGKAENDEIKMMILRKILHTKEVVVAGLDIMDETGEVDWDPYQVGAVCFLHDVGRFPQALLGSYSDVKTGFDHAKAGAEMILNQNFLEAEDLGVNIQVVAEAVREHNKLYYLGKENYAKFIRDVDKLGLMRFIDYHLVDYELPNGEVTKEALEAILAKESVLHKDVKTKIDVYLSWFSWIFDLNFEATKEMLVNDGTGDLILARIKAVDLSAYMKVAQLVTDHDQDK